MRYRETPRRTSLGHQSVWESEEMDSIRSRGYTVRFRVVYKLTIIVLSRSGFVSAGIDLI
jgi:hypothetical protein